MRLQNNNYKFQASSLLSIFVLMFTLNCLALAQEFRIETTVYSGEEEKPVAKAITLFQQDVVYDFLESPKQTAIFRQGVDEKSPGRFILLDEATKLRTEIPTDKIERLLVKLRVWSVKQPDHFVAFLAAPKFKEDYNEKSHKLTLTSDYMVYQAETLPGKKADVMENYRTFSDWYARLNAVTQKGNLPFPRLKLNALLDEQGRLPKKVSLDIPEQSLSLRAEHNYTWRLSKQDQQKITEAQKQLREFKQVDNATFLKESGTQRVAKK